MGAPVPSISSSIKACVTVIFLDAVEAFSSSLSSIAYPLRSNSASSSVTEYSVLFKPAKSSKLNPIAKRSATLISEL